MFVLKMYCAYVLSEQVVENKGYLTVKYGQKQSCSFFIVHYDEKTNIKNIRKIRENMRKYLKRRS